MRLAAASLLVLVFLQTSCSTLDRMLGERRPTADIVGVALRGLDLQGVDLAFDVEVSNPYEVALPILGLDYALSHGSTTFLRGEGAGEGSIPAAGSKVIPVTARVDFLNALNLLGDIRPGAVVDYAAAIGLSVDAPVLGNLRLPLEHDGSFPIPTVPSVSVRGLRLAELSLQRARATCDLAITNDNEFPVELLRLAYSLQLGGRPVATSAVDRSIQFAKGEAQSLSLDFSLGPVELARGAFNLLTGEDAPYQIGGTIDLATGFGDLSFPYQAGGRAAVSRD